MTFAVELRGLKKAFGSVIANADIHLAAQAGSIHAVIGENGAGKSTAMKLLYGIYRPDGGEIFVDGVARSWRSPSDAIECGIGMVHQHFMLADPYDALENIWVGAERGRRFWGREREGERTGHQKCCASVFPRFLRPVDCETALKELEELSLRYGLPVDWRAEVGSLPIGIRQRIEIIKALYRRARILILDEPTAVLTPQETSELFENLRKLRDEGKTILIITHKLKEVLAISDRVTVFRGGRVVGNVETSQTSAEALAELMVGRKVALGRESGIRHEAEPAVDSVTIAQPLLEVRGLTLKPKGLRDLNFVVNSGEILGIAGVEGNGQSELLDVLLHPRDYEGRVDGEVRFLGEWDWRRDGKFLSTAEIRNLGGQGIGVIPQDRHREGLLLDRSVRENFLLGLHHRAPFSRKGLLGGVAADQAILKALESYDFRPAGKVALERTARGLSGGNQQKLIIAREFERHPRILLAAQPTRGVDIGAIEAIHRRILRARAEGVAILLVSSELDEILALSDRILVMYEGAIAGSFARSELQDADVERRLGLLMGGKTE